MRRSTLSLLIVPLLLVAACKRAPTMTIDSVVSSSQSSVASSVAPTFTVSSASVSEPVQEMSVASQNADQTGEGDPQLTDGLSEEQVRRFEEQLRAFQDTKQPSSPMTGEQASQMMMQLQRLMQGSSQQTSSIQ